MPMNATPMAMNDDITVEHHSNTKQAQSQQQVQDIPWSNQGTTLSKHHMRVHALLQTEAAPSQYQILYRDLDILTNLNKPNQESAQLSLRCLKRLQLAAAAGRT